MFHQNTPGVGDVPGMPGAAERLDSFEKALAVGDFDGDGYDDAAIGVPGEALNGNTRANAGAVHILYGSSLGLQLLGSQVLNMAMVSDGYQKAGNRFGDSLAVGNFNNDRFEDLAVGLPGYSIRRKNCKGTTCSTYVTDREVGAVAILLGSNEGLHFADLILQSTSRIGGTNGAGDEFGKTLVAGDFDNDQFDDLAIGAPGKSSGSTSDHGLVYVLYGYPGVLGGQGGHLL